MANTLLFCTSLLTFIASWLMTEPMIYFVGFALGLYTVRIILYLTHYYKA